MSKTSSKILSERSRRRRKKSFFILGTIFLLFVLLHVSGVDAKAPEAFRVLAQKLKLQKPTTKLPADIQKAIEMEAVKELTSGIDPNRSDVLSEVDSEDVKIAESTVLPDNPLYIFKRFGRRFQEFLTFDPLSKTQIILKNNSLETVETLSLLQKILKENNKATKDLKIGIVAHEVARIENKFNQIVNISENVAKTDKNKARMVQATAFNYAEKYLRNELILQSLEDKLDDSSLFKIEDAREKGLGVFAKILTSYHPDPQVLARELASSLAWVTGENYKELKTTEVLQEIEDATSDETQKTSLRLAQYILIQRFEKKVLKLPKNKRDELLTTFVSRLSENPMREFKTLTRVRRVFKSRHLIIFAEIYKAKVLEKFENRVLGLSTPTLQKQFVENWIKDPADLRILEALELRSSGKKLKDPKLIEMVKTLKKIGFDQIAKIYYGNPEKLKDTLFYKSATKFPDVLDIKVAIDLGDKNLETKIEATFGTKSDIVAATEAEIILDSIEVPDTQNAIENLVETLEESPEIALETQILPIPIEEIISEIDTQIIQPTQEEILERTEELTEEIFSAPEGVETPIEEELPSNIQEEIENIQGTTNETPQVNPTIVETVVNTVEQTVQNTPIPTSIPEIIPTTPPATTPVPIETPPPPTISVPSL